MQTSTNIGLNIPEGSDIFNYDTFLKTNFEKLDTYITNQAVIPNAKGDGVIDDTTAIQQALSLSKVLTKGVKIKIPKGTYKLTNMLRIYKNTHLEMDPGTVLLRCHNGSFFANGDATDSFTAYNGNGNIIIEGGVLEGNILAFPDAFNAIGLARGSNITLRNIEIRDVMSDHCIDINACDDVLIDNCKFLGYKDGSSDQSRDYVEAIQIALHTQAGYSTFGAFDGTPSKNITVRDCYFGASGTEGTTAWPVGVGHHEGVHDKYISNVKVYGNTFDGLTYAGVRAYKFVDLFVYNNEFLGCQRDVVVSSVGANTESSKDANGIQSGKPQAGKNIFITNNIMRNTANISIWVAGQVNGTDIAKVKTVYIKDNIFDNDTPNLSHLIYLNWVDTAHVKNNQVNKAYRGLYANFVNDLTFNDNKLNNLTAEAFFMEELDVAYRNAGHTKETYVEGNTIQGCGQSGIQLQYSNGFRVANNTVYSTSTVTNIEDSAILIASGANNGKVFSNKVRMAASGNKNKYGLEVTASCSNVQVFNNDVEGVTGKTSLPSAVTTIFDGYYIQNPNGTRYQVTVSNTGVLTVTAG